MVDCKPAVPLGPAGEQRYPVAVPGQAMHKVPADKTGAAKNANRVVFHVLPVAENINQC
jgi:hypothetical protein